jgi:hypothetical protein
VSLGAYGRSCTFRAALRSGVWTVTRDEVFYGDFLTRAEAVRQACLAARAFEARGGEARVLAPPGETPIPHHR